MEFWPDRALCDAVDPEYGRWRDADEEPLRREIREHRRQRNEEQRRLHGRVSRILKSVRRKVYQRDAGACAQCGAEVDWEEWRCHHVVPYPEGPESVENLVTVCEECHEWLHDGFVRSASAAVRLDEFRQRWERRTSGA